MEPLVESCHDLRLEPGAHVLMVGKSGSGKTTLALKLLAGRTWREKPSKIILLYETFQEVYLEAKKAAELEGIPLVLREGAEIRLEDVEKLERHTILLIDDGTLTTTRSENISKIATCGRPAGVTLVLCWHSLYFNHPASRLTSANCSYLFLLPSLRLNSQISVLDAQLQFRGRLKSAYAAICDETDNDARYLLVDLTSTAPMEFRLRTGINGSPQYVFLAS